MFSQVSVCPRGEVYTPLWVDIPWTDTPGQTPRRHPHQTATAADGTHPTGMHSCFLRILTCKNLTCTFLKCRMIGVSVYVFTVL